MAEELHFVPYLECMISVKQASENWESTESSYEVNTGPKKKYVCKTCGNLSTRAVTTSVIFYNPRENRLFICLK